jgi:hypothetical protein
VMLGHTKWCDACIHIHYHGMVHSWSHPL